MRIKEINCGGIYQLVIPVCFRFHGSKEVSRLFMGKIQVVDNNIQEIKQLQYY